MSRVYVVEAPPLKYDYSKMKPTPKFDVSPAKRFGDIVEVFRIDHDGPLDYAALREEAHETMKDFTAGDYILPTGDPVLIALVALDAYESLPPLAPLQFLKWDRRIRDYVPAAIPFDY